MSGPLRVLLAGYLGAGNCGDEAMVAGAIQWLRVLDRPMELSMLSLDPADAERLHGITAYPALPFGRLPALKCALKPARWPSLRELSDADLVIWLTGSGLFSDAQGPTLARFWPLFRLMRARARRFVFASASVGPIRFPQTESLIRRMLEQCDALCTRDPLSERELIRIAGANPKIVPMADLALHLKPAPPERASAILRAEGLDPGQRYLAFCPLYFFQNERQVPRWREYKEQFAQAIAQVLNTLHARHGLHTLCIPFQTGYDDEISRVVAQKMQSPAHVLTGRYSPGEVAALVGAMRLVVGVRLHSIVLAAMAGVPCVPIVYDDKCLGFVEDCGLHPYSVDYYYWVAERPPLDARQLLDRAEKALADSVSFRTSMHQRIETMTARNATGIHRLAGLLHL